ncbi:hypothetical protein [Sanguibacter massiliensis]|uniref:hypothetical protein n=1 Tax=Sanguibacter massiliensis TaxID=1973217 RepID=UPI000C83D807|nr:hypothetical protein [Sanguibacter massiliensis]
MRYTYEVPTCEHGGDARRITKGRAEGQSRCPMCRAAESRAAWLAAQAAEDERRRAERAAAWARTLHDEPETPTNVVPLRGAR